MPTAFATAWGLSVKSSQAATALRMKSMSESSEDAVTLAGAMVMWRKQYLIEEESGVV
jgi:hypothetical protein